MNIQVILSQVRKLDKEAQMTLLEKIRAYARKESQAVKQSKLSSISGVGADLWKYTDIDDYVEQERQW